MNKISKSFLRFFVEIIVVSFGVFVGIYFGNVNNEKKAQKEKNETISLIKQELDINKIF